MITHARTYADAHTHTHTCARPRVQGLGSALPLSPFAVPADRTRPAQGLRPNNDRWGAVSTRSEDDRWGARIFEDQEVRNARIDQVG